MRLLLDLETASCADLKKTGAHAYAEDSSTRVTVLCYAFESGPVETWTGGPPPDAFVRAVHRGRTVVAHNYLFEFNIYHHCLVPLGWPPISLRQWSCTMARSLVAGYPAGLEAAGAAAGLPVQKDAGTRGLMLRFARPRSVDPLVWWHETDPVRFQSLCDYCARDVEALRGLDAVLPELSPRERAIFERDHSINQAGLGIDHALVDRLAGLTDEAKRELTANIRRLTNGRIISLGQVAKLKEYLLDQYDGYVADMRRDTLLFLLHDECLSGPARSVVEARLAWSRSSTAKLASIASARSQDGRVRGCFQYYGARTGRWSGRRVQPQNFYRGSLGVDVPEALGCIAAGADARDLDMLFSDSPLGVVASCLRSTIVAGPGNRLCLADFSQIEARVLAWLAGQEDSLDIFRSGKDIYTETARAIGSSHRQLGKVLVLACVAKDTPVLTRRGWVPIQRVLHTDLVWDGLSWVKNSGLLNVGMRETLKRHGLPLTREHLVLCENRWLCAQEVAADAGIRFQALATASASLPWQDMSLTSRAAVFSFVSCSAVVAGQSILSSLIHCAMVVHSVVTSVLANNRTLLLKCTGDTPLSSRMTNTADGCSIGSLRVSDAAPCPAVSFGSIMAAEGFSFTRIGYKIVQLFYGISSRSLGGTSPRCNSIGSITIGVTSRGTSALLAVAQICSTGVQWLISNVKSKPWKRKSQVYDLLNCGPRNRYTILTPTGPLIVHNCGFGMSWVKFIGTARGYGVILTEAEANAAVMAWRAVNWRIVQLWWESHKALLRVTAGGPGTMERQGKCAFIRRADAVLVRLPSGRHLVYRQPKIEENPQGHPEFVYMGGFGGHWTEIRMWPGKLVENITQAVARDIMCDAILALPDVPLVGTVHDELVAETPEADADETLNRMLSVMRRSPAWAAGLPVNAAGLVTRRYAKG